MMDLVTFRQMLRLHDWGFGNSEDATTFSRGLVQEMRIEEALGILHARGLGEPAEALYQWWGGYRDKDEAEALLATMDSGRA
jgi:hypothetical protein